MHNARRVLVTGATGFIGRHVVGALVSSGCTVVTAGRSRAQGEGLVHAPADLVSSDFEPERLVRKAAADTLIHLAWITVPGKLRTSDANAKWVEVSARLLEAFLAAGGERIAVTGTGAEYSPPEAGPCHALCTPIGPTDPYGEAKHALHCSLERMAADAGATFAWLRLFNLTGPGEDGRRLLPYVARRLIDGNEALCTPGEQLRDYMDSRDCGRAIAACALSAVAGPLNVASGIPVTVRSLVERLALRLERPDLVKFGAVPYRDSDRGHVYGDITALRDEVGFQPEFRIEHSLDAVIADQRRM